MQKYNRDKRARYNAHIKKINTHDTCDGQAHKAHMNITIHVRYDGHAQTIYIPIIYGKTRNTHAQRYVNIHNAIRDVFPSIDAPHTKHIYRATCEYHKYIPQETYYTRPEPEPDTIMTDTHTAKCIIMNDNDEVIYIGHIRRTRIVNVTKGTIEITLHKGDRHMTAYERATNPDMIIHGITIRDIKAHDVEIYHI